MNAIAKSTATKSPKSTLTAVESPKAAPAPTPYQAAISMLEALNDADLKSVKKWVEETSKARYSEGLARRIEPGTKVTVHKFTIDGKDAATKWDGKSGVVAMCTANFCFVALEGSVQPIRFPISAVTKA